MFDDFTSDVVYCQRSIGWGQTATEFGVCFLESFKTVEIAINKN